ncbi:MAG TPA: HD domain-containing phosphohydrolase [Solirubrobacteraceae bacterium]|jgi:putative two-component system response regulator|nr:HD domain-containing phosphohydrolase [Solirubrobacteraceae bacterium]
MTGFSTQTTRGAVAVGGFIGALTGSLIVFAWERYPDISAFGPLGLAARMVAFVTLGAVAGITIGHLRRIRTELSRSSAAQLQAEHQIAGSARRLKESVAERTYELEHARNETLSILALVAEYRDDATSEHTERVGEIAATIACALGLEHDRIRHLRDAARLHDIGKIAVPDHILLNKGMLSAEEAEIMRTHAEVGARLLRRSSSPVLQMAAVIAATHHEWWDGSGYPMGLAGERIPLVGRVVAVGDVFDALTHDRPYKAAWPTEQAIARIRRGAGTHFDPLIVDAFLAKQDSILAIVLSREQQPAPQSSLI